MKQLFIAILIVLSFTQIAEAKSISSTKKALAYTQCRREIRPTYVHVGTGIKYKTLKDCIYLLK